MKFRDKTIGIIEDVTHPMVLEMYLADPDRYEQIAEKPVQRRTRAKGGTDGRPDTTDS